MKPYFRIATIIYLILLSIVLGAGLFAGIVVAPIVFNSDIYLGTQILTQFQEGQIMAQNFYRLSFMVDVVIISIFLYEGYKYKKFERDLLTQLATLLAIFSGLLFSHYYTLDIMQMQLIGESITTSERFINTHKGSEIDFKIFSFALLVLIVQNMRKACK